MSNRLTPEEVAILVKARKILKEKGLPKDADVTRICEEAGISRKTGYQWAEKLGSLPEEQKRLKQENEALAEKSYGEEEKKDAVSFYRGRERPLRHAAWVMQVNEQSLGQWNRRFDESMRPPALPKKRGRPDEVGADEVKRIVAAAKETKASGARIRLDSFTKLLETSHDITRSRQKVSEILIGNNLYQPQTRKRRPGFYQSLRQSIPNGLLSVDGSDFSVWLGQKPYKFNVELSVDVESFCHTAFSVSETETTEEFIKVMEAHKELWGTPLGLVSDHGSANLSSGARDYLDENEIEPLPAGPGNPKGNGSAESALTKRLSRVGKEIGITVLDHVIVA